MMSGQAPSDPIVVGKIIGAFGVKGWLKVKSFTEPVENIVTYRPWWVTAGGAESGISGAPEAPLPAGQVECDAHKFRPQGLVVHLSGCDDRTQAEAWVGREILVARAELPELDATEYYWHQLLGLLVISEYDNKRLPLGRVTGLMETGANDVLVVKAANPDEGCDARERLIPYVPGEYVKTVDLIAGSVTVMWDPEF